MANRSDFFNAKLPRYLKRALTMQSINMTKEQSNEIKKIMMGAHQSHISHRLKRNTVDNKDLGGE